MILCEHFMQRCFELAENGLGSVAPNPLVGCVIVHKEMIIGEGFHQKFGDAHAEVNAINAAIFRHGEEVLMSSELYVSLEPCAHVGKTPPCADLIIDKKIPRVRISCIDPNPLVGGNGIKKLKAAGVDVTMGMLEKEGRELNRRFMTFHEKKRPYIILKWAQSQDGFIAAKNYSEHNRWISNDYSQKLSHKWRTEEQAILVGATTVLADNPHLTARHWIGKNPLRIIVDPDDAVTNTHHVLDGAAPTIIFSGNKKMRKENTEWIETDFDSDALTFILKELHDRSVHSVIIEGGAFTLQRFIENNLWDEARIFQSTKFLHEGLKAPSLDFSKKTSDMKLLDDRLFILRNNTNH